jgi:hypothetical protein
MDPFLPALEDLLQALCAGEDPDQAIAEIAAEHGLAAHALPNRAVRAFGPLDTYKERQAAAQHHQGREGTQGRDALLIFTEGLQRKGLRAERT